MVRPFLKKTSPYAAFTLIEVLAVAVILAVLTGIVFGMVGSMQGRAQTAAETAAGKVLITAFQGYSTDHDGQILPGMDGGAQPITLPNGSKITMKRALMRYPWRLAPYFDFNINGSLLVGKNARQVKEDGADYNYSVSAFPVLGMNYRYVGGEVSGSGVVSEPDCLTRQAQLDHPILVFASAGAGASYGDVEGYCNIDAPSTGWSSAEPKKDTDPTDYGHVAPRHDGKAVCAFTDGSVRLLTIEELRDMRLWNRNATN